MSKNTIPTTTATYEPLPAIVDAYGLDVQTADDTAIAAAAASVTAATSSLGRKTAEHFVNARNVVGHLLHVYWQRHGGKDGSPVADGTDIPTTWGKVAKVFTPAVFASFGLSESAAGQAWRTWRADGIGRFARWADLTVDESIVASDPSSFDRASADSFLRWAMADQGGRTDKTGRVIVPGSNRSAAGRETKRGTDLAVKRAADKTAKQAVAKAAKARPATDPVRSYLCGLSDDDLAAAVILAPIVQRERAAAAAKAAKAAGTDASTDAGEQVTEMSADDMRAEIARLSALVSQ